MTQQQVPDLIILHAGWLDGDLYLWGETTPEAASAAPVPRARRARSAAATATAASVAPAVATHALPYQVAPAPLGQALDTALPDLAARDTLPTTVTLWLPTAGGAPLASSPLIAPAPGSSTAPAPAPWTTTALRLDLDAAVRLFAYCAGRDTLAPGLLVGDDVRYWVHATRFAASLVLRQSFVPGVERVADSYYARWQPFIAGQDTPQLAQLAQAMPAACRALVVGDAGQPPAAAPRAILVRFVTAVTDLLVRGAPIAAPVPSPTRRPPRSGAAPAYDSIHDQWLAALRAPDSRLLGDQQALASFATQVAEWTQPLHIAQDPSVRLCFRLVAPALDVADGPNDANGANGHTSIAASDDWRVEYVLQATDDPSLLVSAEAVWRARGQHATALAHQIAAPREKLLAALGQAASISPQIEASLRTKEPTGYALDTAGAYQFLTETAWLLEQAGFSVLLPSWWTRHGGQLKLAARAHVKSKQLTGNNRMSLDSLVDVDWEIALGDEPLSYSELEALAHLKAPLVRMRGQWVQVDAQELQAALDYWKKRRSDQLNLGQVVRMALGARDGAPQPSGLAVGSVQADGWVADLLARLDAPAGIQSVPPPPGLTGTLRPYQERGYSWLRFLSAWGLGACLADDMGLGKTIQTLALIAHDRAEGNLAPVLLVCPTSVVENWRKEAQRFTPDLTVQVHHGPGRHRGASFEREAARHALVLTSYALLHRDLDLFKSVAWRAVVLDEAQNIKNPETKQAQAARTIPADFRVALTGTPVENNVGDLWSLMEFLNPGLLGTQTDFKRRYYLPIQISRDPDATARLKRLTGPFLLRRLKTDRSVISDLPEKVEMNDYCTLTREQASLYRAVLKDLEEPLDEAEGIQRKGLILATLMKLKQVCNHPAQFLADNSSITGRSGKLARLEAMLDEILVEGDRVLVFTQFAQMGEMLKRHLQRTYGREVLFLHGGTPRAQRDRMVERFQSDDHASPIFVLSLKAGGTGLNLTRANHVIHFDRWWNPAVENQATDRAFRIGQHRHVQVHKFVCMGTLEERIDELIQSKREIAAYVVGTGEGWLTELSTAQLKDLFALRAEAVED